MTKCNIPSSYDISKETLKKVTEVLNEDIKDLASIFKILSDPIRINVLRSLKVDDLCVCVFVELTEHKYPALSYHLKLLKDAGLIESRKDGNFQMYKLTRFVDCILSHISDIQKVL